jgi:hypothetical protein
MRITIAVSSVSPYSAEARSNTSTVSLRVIAGNEKGSLISETAKYGHRVPRDSDQRMTALARARPLVRESAHHNKRATV